VLGVTWRRWRPVPRAIRPRKPAPITSRCRTRSRSKTGDKIEVLEFFQYSCPHCYRLHAGSDRLAQASGARRGLPPRAGRLRPSRQPHSQIYYALEALNRLDDMHDKVFNAIHVAHRHLLEPSEIADFMAENGIDRRLNGRQPTARSPSSARANQAVQIWTAYKIDGTPTLACDGKYLTAPSMVRSRTRAGCLAVMDYLIERSRRERKKK